MRPTENRRAFLAGVAVLMATPAAAAAESAARVFKVGFLRPGQPPKEWIDAFKRGLGELGYIVDRSVVVEYRFTDGSFDDLPRLADEFVRLKVDVLVASTSRAALAAQKVTAVVPVVFVGVTDPVGIRLIQSLDHPGGNITGLAIASDDLTGKRLQLLKEIVPGLTRVSVLWRRDNPLHQIQLKNAQAAAATFRLQLEVLPISGPSDFVSAFGAARRSGGLLLLDDSLFTTQRKQLAELALASRLPAIYGFQEFAEAGGLLSYGANFPDLYRRAASYVDKILKGTKPGDLPVEQPLLFKMVVNLKTAKSLGLTIPQSVLLRADRVVE